MLQALIAVLGLVLLVADPSYGDVNKLVEGLQSADDAVRSAAYEGAADYGPQAIAAVAPLLHSDNPSTVRAAKLALEKIVGVASADFGTQTLGALELSRALKTVTTPEGRNWLLWLFSYAGLSAGITEDAETGEKVDHIAELAEVLDDPEAFDMAMFALQGVAGSEPGRLFSVQGMHRWLGSADEERLLFLEALSGSVNQVVREAFIPRLGKAEPNERIAIINTVGAIESACEMTFEEPLKVAPESRLRVASVGASPSGEAMDVALKEAARPGPEALYAIEALGRMGAIEAEKIVWEKIEATGDPRAVHAYLKIAERQEGRPAQRMYQKLLHASREPYAECAALLGLGKAGDAKAIKTIVPYLTAERADVYGAADAALLDLEGRGVDRQIKVAMRRAEPEVKAALLEVLAERDVQAAKPLLEKAANEDNLEVRLAALRLLGETPQGEYEGLFLDRAEKGAEQEKPVALTGYIRIAHGCLDRDPTKALEMYHRALDLATEDAPRRMALEGMRQIASPESLPYLEKLESGDLADEAAQCALAIADSLVASDPARAEKVYRDVAGYVPSIELAEWAGRGLKALGVAVDLAGAQGFLTQWMLIGPFPKTSFDAVFPPETEFKAKATYQGAGAVVRWQDYRVEHLRGIIRLDELYRPKDDVIAYGRAEVAAPCDVDVLLKIGSDDGVICWLNGERVHVNNVSRGVRIDNDVVPARLRAGKNVILVKIVQGGGDWGFCLRITDHDGRPLQLQS